MSNLDKNLFEIELKKFCSDEYGNSPCNLIDRSSSWDITANVRNALVRTTGILYNTCSMRSAAIRQPLDKYVPRLKELLEKHDFEPLDIYEYFEYLDKDQNKTIRDKMSNIYISGDLVIDIAFYGTIDKLSTIFIDNIYFHSGCAEKALDFSKEYSKLLHELSDQDRTNEEVMYARLLISTRSGLSWMKLTIPPKDSLEIEENYSKEFLETVPEKMDKFFKENSGGIAIFRGEPGTGKSTYCKYLIKKYQKDVNFLIVSQDIILSNPEGFRMFLLESVVEERDNYDDNYYDSSCTIDGPVINPVREVSDQQGRKTVVIIEDCEKLLVDRDSLSGNNTSIILSDILNYTDGIVGDLIQCKFIFTFNTNLSKIDKALLRKGRMKLNYEFQKLKGEDLQKLSEKLGKNFTEEELSKGLTLAEVYNIEEEDYTEKKRTIGF